MVQKQITADTHAQYWSQKLTLFAVGVHPFEVKSHVLGSTCMIIRNRFQIPEYISQKKQPTHLLALLTKINLTSSGLMVTQKSKVGLCLKMFYFHCFYEMGFTKRQA